MAAGKRRIALHTEPDSPTFWSRVVAWFSGGPTPPTPLDESGIDRTLAIRAERRAVRAFIEAIDSFQLHNRRTVHVVSRYRIPPDPGLQERVPEWLAHRVRFGAVRGELSDIGYLKIRAVDVVWTDEGTELYLHMARKVVPGTRAFVGAYLGEAGGEDAMDRLPSTLLVGPNGS